MTLNIKAALSSFIIPAAFCLFAAAPASAENLLSFQVGVYSPGSDYPESKDDGGDFGIFYTNTHSRVGFEFGVHGYRTRLKGDSDIGVVGAELLFTFQDPMASVQPYAGLGVGYYAIEVDYERGGGQRHNGNGFVAEVGVRGYLEGIFIGFQVKGFTNHSDEASRLTKDSDYGGVGATLILGVIF
jgi:hypothetical protein